MDTTGNHIVDKSMHHLLRLGHIITMHQYMKSLTRFDASVRKSPAIMLDGLTYHYDPHVDASIIVFDVHLQYVLLRLPRKVKMWDDPHTWHLVWDTWTLTLPEFMVMVCDVRGSREL